MKQGSGKNAGRESLNPSKERPSLWKRYEARRAQMPVVIPRAPLSIEQICEREGATVKTLEPILRTRFESWEQDMRNALSYPDLESLPLLETMYSLSLLANRYREDDATVAAIPWIRNFCSFDSFVGHFCPHATPNARAYMMKNIQIFTEVLIHPSRLLEIPVRSNPDWGNLNEIYTAGGTWKLAPMYFYDGGFDLIERSVIAEIIELLESDYREPDYAHTTGSAALNGIAEHATLLSGEEAVKRGTAPTTGEHVSYIQLDSGLSVSAGAGNSSIYVHHGPPVHNYHVLRWFDEHPVAFGINKERQEAFLEGTTFRYGHDTEPKTLSKDHRSEGVVIGHMVPLTAVDYVYCWKLRQEEMQIWVAKHCSHTKVVSLEAACALFLRKKSVNAIAAEERIAPIDVWRRVLNS